VVDLQADLKVKLTKALTFEELPTEDDFRNHARTVGDVIIEFLGTYFGMDQEGEIIDRAFAEKVSAMIGGAPFFMATLESAVLDCGCTPVYAFSKREVQEKVAEDGSVVKTAVFRHLGFIEA
jgi:hypothetical protein